MTYDMFDTELGKNVITTLNLENILEPENSPAEKNTIATPNNAD